MENHFNKLSDNSALEDLIKRSHERPVVIFKHSTTCSISTAAYEQMARIEEDVALVVVQDARDVSREIEARTGVAHESPQVIILRSGKPVWHESHWQVRADAVRDALGKNP